MGILTMPLLARQVHTTANVASITVVRLCALVVLPLVTAATLIVLALGGSLTGPVGAFKPLKLYPVLVDVGNTNLLKAVFVTPLVSWRGTVARILMKCVHLFQNKKLLRLHPVRVYVAPNLLGRTVSRAIVIPSVSTVVIVVPIMLTCAPWVS